MGVESSEHIADQRWQPGLDELETPQKIPFARALEYRATASVAVVAMSSGARAQQQDTNPPPPNVLILLDNSGSMERMIDGAVPEDEGNLCNFDPTTGHAVPVAPTAWCTEPRPAQAAGHAVDADHGSFRTTGCASPCRAPRAARSRTRPAQINGVKPYDADYYLNYHRPVMVDADGTPCVVSTPL